MERALNETGSYCFQSFGICDHNMLDSTERRNYCTGLGGKCSNGEKWEFGIKEHDMLLHLTDLARLSPKLLAQLRVRPER